MIVPGITLLGIFGPKTSWIVPCLVTFEPSMERILIFLNLSAWSQDWRDSVREFCLKRDPFMLETTEKSEGYLLRSPDS